MTIAYLLVWVWEEHKLHAMQQLRPEERQMVILLDEAEAHLHPRWQRLILPGLLTVAQELHSEMSAQWIISTHSPLVLASTAGNWDKTQDRLFHLDINHKHEVTLDEMDYLNYGAVDSWLSSDVFQLRYPGSKDREDAILQALSIQQASDPTKEDVEIATEGLRRHLADEDPFWVRWIFFAESKRGYCLIPVARIA